MSNDKITIGVDYGAPDRDFTAMYLRLGGSGMHIPDPWASELAKLLDRAERMEKALKWYLENDDVNLNDPDNQFYIDGHNAAKEALK